MTSPYINEHVQKHLKKTVSGPGQVESDLRRVRVVILPVDAGALDAHGDSQVDGGPARFLLPAVAATVVPGATQGHGQRPLSGGARRVVPPTRDREGLFGMCVLSVGSLSVRQVDAALQSAEPGLPQDLRVGLQSAAPDGHNFIIHQVNDTSHQSMLNMLASYFWTDSSSKQERRSTCSRGLTAHSRRSSNKTIASSCRTRTAGDLVARNYINN